MKIFLKQAGKYWLQEVLGTFFSAIQFTMWNFMFYSQKFSANYGDGES